MPTLLLGSLFFSAPETIGVDIVAAQNRITILILIFFITFLSPALAIYYLYRIGYITSLHVETLSERRLPYLITLFFYGFGAYFFYQKLPEIGVDISLVLTAMACSIFFTAIISLYWQISAHAVGIGGVVGALAAVIIKFGQTQLIYLFLGSVIVAGLVMSVRLQLNAHTPTQVGSGLILGIMVSTVAVLFFL